MKIANGMEFVNDEKVVGKWEYFDVINSMEEFNSEKEQEEKGDKGFKQIYFLPNGENYWIFEGWTKGYLLIHHGGDDPILCYTYSTKEVGDDLYMFINIEDEYGKYINVLKKVSSERYNAFDIGRRESIDYPFETDEKIIGKWKSAGFVEKIEEFDPKIDQSDILWLKSAEFLPDGSVIRKYGDSDVWTDKWTKGALLDQRKHAVCHYTFREFDGKEYMFIEWKMGNYVFGGMDPDYYVFERV